MENVREDLAIELAETETARPGRLGRHNLPACCGTPNNHRMIWIPTMNLPGMVTGSVKVLGGIGLIVIGYDSTEMQPTTRAI